MPLMDRTMSECSDDLDIRPLELEDLRRRLDERSGDSQVNREKSDGEECGSLPKDCGSRFFSAVYGMGIKRKRERQISRRTVAKMAWKNASMKALALGDPWEKFHLDTYKTEKARRHRYNALQQCWVLDEVVLKMEDQPFNNGAMRECFRMKKLSNFMNDDWTRALNYVAKRYMDESTPRQTYFDDVMLQMDAKLWGEEYNRHNPPKKVDIFQMAVLELYEREGNPLYHIEHFIEGNYVKYNSNSGFVRSKAIRMTPQAFSHFTFERSGHELIVVDIQGVGDLYTDPQIHTSKGHDYGDGNLGTRGMALFLQSHQCNSICKSLSLTEFDLAPSEIKHRMNDGNVQHSDKTKVRGTEEIVITPTEEEKCHIQNYIRLRSLSSGYSSGEDKPRVKLNSVCSVDSLDGEELQTLSESEDSIINSDKRDHPGNKARLRFDSTCDSGLDTETKENNLLQFKEMIERKSRPSHVLGEMEHRKQLELLQQNMVKTGGSILGQIHLDLAKYHELNRFVEESETYDKKAALFHVEQAGRCSNLEAIKALAQLHLGLPHDILPDLDLSEDECEIEIGYDYLHVAAEAGDRVAMIYLAKAYDTGTGLPPSRMQDWEKAVYWLNKAVNTNTEDEEGNYDGTMYDPQYQLVARQAMMYWTGGHGLNKNPNKAGEMFSWAAELATEAMKGKLASKFFMQAEEAWAECEEEGE